VAAGHVTSLHRSKISENFDFKEYVIDAGSGSRIRPAAAEPLLLFGDKNSQQYAADVALLGKRLSY
jgi:hypothetical protein